MGAQDRFPLSRRQMVGGIGLAATAGSPALADAPLPAAPMQDPTTKYPRPPYKRQTQPWPGLAGEMDPKPDHGESSCCGANRLAGRRALITCGDSGMGRAGQPAELAGIYVQLAADDGSFATGQVYGAAGGTGQP